MKQYGIDVGDDGMLLLIIYQVDIHMIQAFLKSNTNSLSQYLSDTKQHLNIESST